MTDMIELLEEYEAWKKRLHHPDNSLPAFKDYYFTQQVLEAALKHVYYADSEWTITSALDSLDLSEDVIEWMTARRSVEEFDLE